MEITEKIAQAMYYQHVSEGFEWLNENEWFRNKYLDFARQILTLIKEAGYVRLAKDQNLPPEPESYYGYGDVSHTYKAAQQDMLKLGFRKVEEAEE